MSDAGLPGVRRSPNIWDSPEVYEQQNEGVDRAGAIEAAICSIQDWAGLHLLDIGCGAGFHLPTWGRTARKVTGVEPHPPLVERAKERIRRLAHTSPDVARRITVHRGSAESLPVVDGTVDVAHARWAYFFGPGCEPGLAELDRVMAPGGVAFIIDNDASRSTFGSWFRHAWPDWDVTANERFWRRRGFSRQPVDIRWDFPDRHTFESVVRIEFPPEAAQAVLTSHDGTGVDYALNLWWRRY